jgi:hypothetical protein
MPCEIASFNFDSMNDLKSLPNPVVNHATLIGMLGNYAPPNDKIRSLISELVSVVTSMCIGRSRQLCQSSIIISSKNS